MKLPRTTLYIELREGPLKTTNFDGRKKNCQALKRFFGHLATWVRKSATFKGIRTEGRCKKNEKIKQKKIILRSMCQGNSRKANYFMVFKHWP